MTDPLEQHKRSFGSRPRDNSLAGWNTSYVQSTPQMSDIGLSIIEVGQNCGTMKLPANPRWLGDPLRGLLHPGVLTVLADSACGFAVGVTLAKRVTYATLDLRMDYLRSASPDQDVYCEAECFRLTRNVAFTRGTVWQSQRDEPIAHVLGTFMLSTPSAAPGARRASSSASNPLATPDSEWRAPLASEPVRLETAIPYVEYLGIRIAPHADRPVFRLPFHERLVGNPHLPAIHGGVVAGFSETAATLHLIQTLKGEKFPKCIDFSIDYLRSGRPEETFASCEVVRVGTRAALVHVRCWQKSPDYPITVSRAQFLMTPTGR